MFDWLLISLAVGWRRYVEVFWIIWETAVYSAKEHGDIMRIPEMSEQLRAAIVGVVVVALVTLVPQFEPLKDSLAEIVGIVISFILGKSGVEVANAIRSNKN